MRNVAFPEIKEALLGRKRILVASHLRPDPDAYGSAIAAALWLRAEGHEVTVWNEDGMLEKYAFLPSSELVMAPPAEASSFDAVLALGAEGMGLVKHPIHQGMTGAVKHHDLSPRLLGQASGQTVCELVEFAVQC